MNTERAEAEALLNGLLPFAKQMLNRFGEFQPFGGYMLDDRSVVHVGLESDSVGTGSGRVQARQLEKRLFEIASAVRPLAVGLVTNVSLRTRPLDSQNAAEVAIEHRKGYSAEVFFPYRVPAKGHGIAFLEATAQQGRRGRFFPKGSNGDASL